MPHREPVLRINSTGDGTFIACSQDGMVTFWSPAMDVKRSRSVVVSNECEKHVSTNLYCFINLKWDYIYIG